MFNGDVNPTIYYTRREIPAPVKQTSIDPAKKLQEFLTKFSYKGWEDFNSVMLHVAPLPREKRGFYQKILTKTPVKPLEDWM